VQQCLAALEHAAQVEQIRSALGTALEALPAGIRPRSAAPPGAVSTAREQKRRTELLRWARGYEASDGTKLWVGRDARGNDMLTTRVARPHDVWMHVKGYTGSHVVIVLERGVAPSSEALLDAATLAAHFSDARGNDKVELSWCERRHVRKPKGAPPGQVVASREKNLLLRFEPDRLQRLLATVR
jgi:predicted ribosome quality control (RQC) complex YloA/Tae2 family protein